MAGGSLLDLVQSEVDSFNLTSSKTLPWNQTMLIRGPVPKISSFEITKVLNFLTLLQTL